MHRGVLGSVVSAQTFVPLCCEVHQRASWLLKLQLHYAVKYIRASAEMPIVLYKISLEGTQGIMRCKVVLRKSEPEEFRCTTPCINTLGKLAFATHHGYEMRRKTTFYKSSLRSIMLWSLPSWSLRFTKYVTFGYEVRRDSATTLYSFITLCTEAHLDRFCWLDTPRFEFAAWGYEAHRGYATVI